VSGVVMISPSCYTDLDEAPWRCPNRAAYELIVASLASHTLMLCVDCTANYRRDWPDDVISIRTLHPPTPIPIISGEFVEAGS